MEEINIKNFSDIIESPKSGVLSDNSMEEIYIDNFSDFLESPKSKTYSDNIILTFYDNIKDVKISCFGVIIKSYDMIEIKFEMETKMMIMYIYNKINTRIKNNEEGKICKITKYHSVSYNIIYNFGQSTVIFRVFCDSFNRESQISDLDILFDGLIYEIEYIKSQILSKKNQIDKMNKKSTFCSICDQSFSHDDVCHYHEIKKLNIVIYHYFHKDCLIENNMNYLNKLGGLCPICNMIYNFKKISYFDLLLKL